jgi:hypothetical protein
VVDTQTLTYQYSQTSSGANYCITATNKNVSYKISQDTKPIAGGCAGHSANGNSTITNISTNPRATAAGTGWSSNDPSIYPIVRGVTISGHPAGIVTAIQSQLAAGKVTPYVMSVYNPDTLANSATTRTFGVWVMVNTSGYQARIAATGIPTVWTPLTANTWTYVQSAGGYTGYASIYIAKVSGNAGASDISYATGGIVVAGSTNYNYADGYSSDWVWNGTANNSTSTGLPK